MTEIPDGFVPVEDYEHMKQEMFEEREKKLKLLDRCEQLEQAIDRMGAGIMKASEIQIQKQETVNVTVESWRRCREIAMDLLHIPMGGEEIRLLLELNGDKLLGIKESK